MDTSGEQSRKPFLKPPLLKVGGLLLLTGVALFAIAPIFLKIAPPPLVDTSRIIVDDVYQSIDRTKRIPAEFALPHVARAGLRQFMNVLPLEESVRERVKARLSGRDFVDELVPFLLMVKDLYVAPDEMDVVKFSDYIEANYKPEDDLPGMEHSMFTWQSLLTVDDKKVDDKGGETDEGFGLNLELAAQLVTLYDVLYLVENSSAQGVIDRLACSTEEISSRLEVTSARVKPSVRVLLEKVRDGMAPEAEFRHSIDGILTDDKRLETITLSLVQFLDLMVCKHYRMFASRVSREQQLLSWLNGELDKPDGGNVWAYLDHAQNQRKYGVLIAVDGLQGHLVEALATNGSDSPFVQQIRDEQAQGMAKVRGEDAEKLAQQTRFLDHFAKQGFEHNAYLPFFSDLFTFSGTRDTFHPMGVARSGISTTPTISVRNLPIIKTGAPVSGNGATGVPNFHFVDRHYQQDGVQQGRAYYFFGNDALQLTSLTQAAGMKTLFERLPNLSSFSCAAQYDDFANAGIDPFLNLALGEALRDFGEVLCYKELSQRLANEQSLQSLRKELLELRDRLSGAAPWYNWYRWWNKRTADRRGAQLVQRIAQYESRGLPELMVYYNPWPDHFAHFKGPFADEVIAPSGELARLDYWLGQLMGLYKQAGVIDRALFGMSGDHGLAPVFQLVSPQARVLTPLQEQGVPINIIKISSDEGEGPKLTHVLRPPSMRGYDVVIASTAGGNLMLDLFVNQTDRWAEQPLEVDLRRWQPIAWQQAGADKTIDLVDEIIKGLGETLEYMVVRTASGNSASQTDIAIYSVDGKGEIQRREEKIYYHYSGDDLLNLAQLSRYDRFDDADRMRHKALIETCMQQAIKADVTTWCDEAQWRELASFTSKPDAVVQLAHLYDSSRAGSINLFPAQGVAYNSIVPGRHAGESFHEKDAFAGIWGEPISMRTGARLQSAMGGSIPMSIFEHLTGQPVTQGQDGWGYPSLGNIHLTEEVLNDSQ